MGSGPDRFSTDTAGAPRPMASSRQSAGIDGSSCFSRQSSVDHRRDAKSIAFDLHPAKQGHSTGVADVRVVGRILDEQVPERQGVLIAFKGRQQAGTIELRLGIGREHGPAPPGRSAELARSSFVSSYSRAMLKAASDEVLHREPEPAGTPSALPWSRPAARSTLPRLKGSTGSCRSSFSARAYQRSAPTRSPVLFALLCLREALLSIDRLFTEDQGELTVEASQLSVNALRDATPWRFDKPSLRQAEVQAPSTRPPQPRSRPGACPRSAGPRLGGRSQDPGTQIARRLGAGCPKAPATCRARPRVLLFVTRRPGHRARAWQPYAASSKPKVP